MLLKNSKQPSEKVIFGKPSFLGSLIADIPYLCTCVRNRILFLLPRGILMSCHVKQSHYCPSGHQTEPSFIYETMNIPYSVPLFSIFYTANTWDWLSSLHHVPLNVCKLLDSEHFLVLLTIWCCSDFRKDCISLSGHWKPGQQLHVVFLSFVYLEVLLFRKMWSMKRVFSFIQATAFTVFSWE